MRWTIIQQQDKNCHSTKRHGKTLSERQSRRAVYYIMSTLWHSGKDKTKEQWVPGAGRREGRNRPRKRGLFIGQWKYCVRNCTAGHMSLYTIIPRDWRQHDYFLMHNLSMVYNSPCRLISSSKETTLMSEVGCWLRRDQLHVVSEDKWNSCVSPLSNLSVNLNRLYDMWFYFY